MFLKVQGVKIHGKKRLSIKSSIVDVLNPPFVYFPLVHDGITYKRVVEIGSYVKMGQPILYREDRYAHPVCSSVSGTVKDIRKVLNASGNVVEMIEIQNDFKEAKYYTSSNELDLTKDF